MGSNGGCSLKMRCRVSTPLIANPATDTPKDGGSNELSRQIGTAATYRSFNLANPKRHKSGSLTLPCEVLYNANY